MIFRRILKPETAQTPIPYALSEQTYAIDILARTLWGEARGETLAGKEAVACVILNRLKKAKTKGRFWWGNSLEEICLKPYQFSCWNQNDVNYRRVIAVTDADPHFAICLRIARRAVNELLNDATNGADHYHADTITPSWSEGRAPTAIIGRHLFYRLED